MSLVAGIDPGASGACAIYCTETRKLVSVEDLPMYFQTVGKKQRKRIDPIALMELFDEIKMLGVGLAVLELVGGRPQQSATAAFAFGVTVGLIYGNIMRSGIMVETVTPQLWKKMMKVPGKAGGKDKTKEDKKKASGDIMNRVSELFPDNQDMFRTPRGAYRMDRADAALLSKYGGDFLLSSYGKENQNKAWDDILRESYRRIEA